MNTLSIINYTDPILHQKAKKVKDPLEPELQRLILAMQETVVKNDRCIGLAAPQVGKSLRICVIENNGVLTVFINPQITSSSREKSLIEEGCLSIPGKLFLIERAENIKVRYLDEMGKKCKMKAEGFFARAIQHEIDHLEGILITDKIHSRAKII
jgi:peptide deformylase